MKPARTVFKFLISAAALFFFSMSQGCGLGTVGIILGVVMSKPKEEEKPVPTVEPPSILFQDAFENGLANWTVAGLPAPSITSGGSTSMGLDPGGTTIDDGEAVTKWAFNLDSGLSVSADLRMPDLGSSNADIWFGVDQAFAADGRQSLLAGFYLFGALSQVRMLVGSVTQATVPVADTDWHSYQVWIRPDCRVEFYIDGSLAGVSTDKVDPLADHGPVTIGGRSVGAAVRADSVEVFGHKPGRKILFADSFGTDLTGWTVGGTPAPAIDVGTQGRPSPSLNPGGAAAAFGEAVTVQRFAFLEKGIEIRADLYVSSSTVNDLSAYAGLAHVNGLAGDLSLAAGAALLPDSGGAEKISYLLNNVEAASETGFLPGWHEIRIRIRPTPDKANRFVEFLRNGRVVWSGPQFLNASYDGYPVVVGGKNAGGTARIDNVAVLEPPSSEVPWWTSLTESGGGPSAQIEGHVFTWDTKRNRGLVLFGGPNLTASANVYQLLISGSSASWSALTPAGTAPTARVRCAGAYSAAHDAVFVAMGASDAVGTSIRQEVLKLDFAAGSSGTWSTAASGWGAAGPSYRFGHSFSPDPANGRFILFGGRDAAQVLSDAYEFDPTGGSWNLINALGGPPTPRFRHGAVFDEASSSLVVFGGDDGSGSACADSMWRLDLSIATPAWTALVPAGTGPGARFDFGLVADQHRRKAYLMSGTDGVTVVTDFFIFELAGGSDGAWSNDMSGVGSPLSAGRNPALAFVPALKQVVSAGGSGATGSLIGAVE